MLFPQDETELRAGVAASDEVRLFPVEGIGQDRDPQGRRHVDRQGPGVAAAAMGQQYVPRCEVELARAEQGMLHGGAVQDQCRREGEGHVDRDFDEVARVEGGERLQGGLVPATLVPADVAFALGIQGQCGRLAVEHHRVHEHQLADSQAALLLRLGGEPHDLPDGRVAEHMMVLVAEHVDRIGRDPVDDVVGGSGVKDLDKGLPGRRLRRGAHELAEPLGGVPVHHAHPVLVAGDPVRLLVGWNRVDTGAERGIPQAFDEPAGDVHAGVGHRYVGTKRCGHDFVPLAGGDDPVQQVDQRSLDLKPVRVGHSLEQRTGPEKLGVASADLGPDLGGHQGPLHLLQGFEGLSGVELDQFVHDLRREGHRQEGLLPFKTRHLGRQEDDVLDVRLDLGVEFLVDRLLDEIDQVLAGLDSRLQGRHDDRRPVLGGVVDEGHADFPEVAGVLVQCVLVHRLVDQVAVHVGDVSGAPRRIEGPGGNGVFRAGKDRRVIRAVGIVEHTHPVGRVASVVGQAFPFPSFSRPVRGEPVVVVLGRGKFRVGPCRPPPALVAAHQPPHAVRLGAPVEQLPDHPLASPALSRDEGLGHHARGLDPVSVFVLQAVGDHRVHPRQRENLGVLGVHFDRGPHPGHHLPRFPGPVKQPEFGPVGLDATVFDARAALERCVLRPEILGAPQRVDGHVAQQGLDPGMGRVGVGGRAAAGPRGPLTLQGPNVETSLVGIEEPVDLRHRLVDRRPGL